VARRPEDVVVERLLAERGRALTGYAYLLCGSVHDAEDLVQDALVKTFARRRAGLALESAEGYVRRAILTLYLDGWRKRRRWATRLPTAAEPAWREGPADAVGDRIDVVAALATLPRRQRACIVLRFYEDRTVAEIADVLGIGEGTVKRYLSMATRRLEAVLGPIPARETQLVLEA
jgi:RNA polymerase sigma-70 factor (ECF subfamily)